MTNKTGENIKRCVVIGSNGQFGTIISNKLAACCDSLTGIDINENSNSETLFDHYFESSITSLTDDAKRALRESDCTILCVPEQEIVQSIPALFTLLPESSLIVDIASVKSRIKQTVPPTGSGPGYLSIHPMFGPMTDFSGRVVCSVSLRENSKTKIFIEILRAWGPKVITMSADDHDEATAFVQVLPHATLLAFGLALTNTSVSIEKIFSIATPIQRIMLALVLRVVTKDEETYWSIQADNPCASTARENLLEQVQHVSTLMDNRDRTGFADMFQSIENSMMNGSDEFTQLAEELVEISRAR
jgi:prephenate dehydrogenase